MAASELNLIHAISRRSGSTYEQVVEAHQQQVLRTAYGMLGRVEDAQDAAQEVFLRLLKKWNSVEGDASAWLYRVTVNVCNDHFRKRRPASELIEVRDSSPNPEQVLREDQRRRLLMEGLETLAERERQAVVLRDIEGLSTREVAGILGIEEVTVRTQIHSARLKLAKYVRSRV